STDVVVRDLTIDAELGLVIASSLVELRGVAVTSAARGIELSGATTATITRARITDGGPASQGPSAVSVMAPARLTARDVALDAPRGRGIAVDGAGAHASLESVIVARAGGTAIFASNGARVDGFAVVVTRAGESAIEARDVGTTVGFAQLFSRGSARHGAVSITEAASAALEGVRVEEAEASAIHVVKGAALVLRDALITDHLARTSTIAVHVDEASVELERVSIERFEGRALRSVESTLVARDVGIDAGGDGAVREGLVVRGGTAEVSRLFVRDSLGQAIELGVDKLDRATSATLEDVTVVGARMPTGSGPIHAILVNPSTRLVLRRARLADGETSALTVLGPDTELVAEDVTIVGTPFTALSVLGAVRATITRLAIEDSSREVIKLSAPASGERLVARLGDVRVLGPGEGAVPIGVATVGDVDAELSRFVLEAVDVGLDVGGPVGENAVRVFDGQVVRATTGVRVVAGVDALEAAAVLDHVRFRAVTVPFARRP
ncbi:hypothetical protein L6R52_08765, partial [Myxococcota bacterium]|nr:hypothetical protein [Myxococcota bacterium]